MKVGWIGNYLRGGKAFDLAFKACKEYGHELCIAGPPGTELHVKRSDMPHWIRGKDMILSTSRWECHPLIMYETVASGVPFAIEESVGDGFINNVNGVAYYSGHSVDSIGDVFKAVEDNYDDLVDYGLRCINDYWTWDKISEQYYNMFSSLTGEQKPLVLLLVAERDWSLGFMAEEIKRFVNPRCRILYLNELPNKDVLKNNIKNVSLIVNYAWDTAYDMGLMELIPRNIHIMGVNGPKFINHRYMNIFHECLKYSSGLTSVSRNIINMLQFMGKPLYYASNGVNTNLFHPKLSYYLDDYFSKQEQDVIDRLNELGVDV